MEHLSRKAELDKVYIDIAKTVATLSRCNKRKVGAIIVKDGNIVGFGFNGTPKGMCNDCEDQTGKTYPWVVHAEANAILKAGKDCEGADIYCTCFPCYQCAVLIKQAGIVAVYYAEEHKNDGRLDALNLQSFKI